MPWNLIESGRANVARDPSIPPELKAQLLPLFDQVDDLLNVDAWDGYQAARGRLQGMLERIGPSNPVIVTGDIHSAWAADLLSDFADPENADMVAAEFVATSISSTFLAVDPRPADFLVCQGLADNPHIRYFNGLFRGYCLCDVDTERWETTYRAVGDLGAVTNPDPLALLPYPDTSVATDAVFTVNAGFNALGSGERIQGDSRLPATQGSGSGTLPGALRPGPDLASAGRLATPQPSARRARMRSPKQRSTCFQAALRPQFASSFSRQRSQAWWTSQLLDAWSTRSRTTGFW
jgi:hypothetical protein